MGCFKETDVLNIMKSHSSLNYGFSFFTKNPNDFKHCCHHRGSWAECILMDPSASRSFLVDGVKPAKLYGKFVAHTFADGVDLDMEHPTPYNRMGDQFDGMVAFIQSIEN